MIAIKNGKIITPNEIVEGKILLIEEGKIVGFSDNAKGAERVVNAHGRWIMPGLIDIHSDKFEQYIQPRPTSQIDFEFALKVFERDLLSVGITTMYHSISLLKNEFFGKSMIRTKGNVIKIANLLANIHNRNHLIHHRFHLRLEIDNIESFDLVKNLIQKEKINLLSFMDHTPGQGQYSDLAIYRETISKLSEKEVNEKGFEYILNYHKNKEIFSCEQLVELTELAHANKIAVASHDDDTKGKLELNKRIGVDISEFPITLEIAKLAREYGYYTVVGAVNILRGNSHTGNLSATEAILEDCADIICSDYYPGAVLQSIFYMHNNYKIPISKMVNKATLNPAKATKTDQHYGSIELGKKADILIVEELDNYPVITHVFIDGRTTSRIEYRR